MLSLPQSVRIFLATEHCDMRKGFDGLSLLVRQQGLDLFSGHLFVFLSRRRDRVKILTFDNGGFVLYYKRLEKARFKMPCFLKDQKTLRLEPSQLIMLLDGIDFSRVRKPRLWKPQQSDSTNSF